MSAALRIQSVSLRNYRCFSEQEGVSLAFDSGHLALVGQNNSGKTAALRAIYELQVFWIALSQPGFLRGSDVPARAVSLNFREVPEADDVFCDLNDRPLRIGVAFAANIELTMPYVKKLDLTWRRDGFVDIVCELNSGGERGALSIQNGDELADVWQATDQSGTSILVPNLHRALAHLISCQYLPPTRNLVNAGGGSHFGLNLGSNFISLWNLHKTNGPKAGARAARETEALIGEIFGFPDLQINATNNGTDLQLLYGRHVRRIGELGHGVAQFIITIISLTFTKPALLLFDEPEIGLHPALQVRLLTKIVELTGAQLIFATHSMGLARAMAPANTLVFRHDGISSSATPLRSRTPNLAEFLGEMSYSSWREIGCDTVLLVEGVTDVPVITHFVGLLRKHMKVVVLPMGGSELIKTQDVSQIKELTRLADKVAVLVDSEKQGYKEDIHQHRKNFLAQMALLQISAHALERRAIENYFPERVIQEVIGSSSRALMEFENIKNSGAGWGKGDIHQIAARMELDDLKDTDLLRFLNAL